MPGLLVQAGRFLSVPRTLFVQRGLRRAPPFRQIVAVDLDPQPDGRHPGAQDTSPQLLGVRRRAAGRSRARAERGWVGPLPCPRRSGRRAGAPGHPASRVDGDRFHQPIVFRSWKSGRAVMRGVHGGPGIGRLRPDVQGAPALGVEPPRRHRDPGTSPRETGITPEASSYGRYLTPRLEVCDGTITEMGPGVRERSTSSQSPRETQGVSRHALI